MGLIKDFCIIIICCAKPFFSNKTEDMTASGPRCTNRYCNSLMYFCMASRRCGIGVVGWYVGTLGIGICGTENPNNSVTIIQSQYSSQLENGDLCDLLLL